MTLAEQIVATDISLAKLYRRHRDVLRSIEQIQAYRQKLIREKERQDGKKTR